ncbi:MAG: 50S ribosomal protein L28 [bacterium]|nr:50S ribosomal protein L28 [bacterium]
MSQVCAICGKKPLVGNNVSHSNHKTKKRSLPNLQRVKSIVDGKPKYIKVCTKCIKKGRIAKA